MLVRLGSLSTLLCRLLEEQHWAHPAVHIPLAARLAADGAALTIIDAGVRETARVRLYQRLAAVCACFLLSMAFFDAAGTITYANGQPLALIGGSLRSLHNALRRSAQTPAGNAGNALAAAAVKAAGHGAAAVAAVLTVRTMGDLAAAVRDVCKAAGQGLLMAEVRQVRGKAIASPLVCMYSTQRSAGMHAVLAIDSTAIDIG